jgi:hypothetical protein
MTLTYGLILLTWLVYIGGLMGVGLLAVRLLFPATRGRDAVQGAVWWGVAAFVLVATALGLVAPLSSTAGLVTLTLLLGGGWIALIVLAVPRLGSAWRALLASYSWRRLPALATAALFVGAQLMIVRFAAGAPMDGDSALYRVGAITYAARYGPVPGLANLHDRLGFNTSTSTTAALMDNGLWVGQSYRLIVGLFLTALLVAVILRLLFPRAGGASAGDWFAVIGTAFVIALVLTDSGRWVPSPASDMAVVVFGVAATCFLLDALQGRAVALSASTALVAAATAGSVRPLGWMFAAMVGLVLVLRVARDERGRARLRGVVRCVAPGAVVAAVLLVVMLARDAIVSGWLLYPSTFIGLDVPWRTIPGTQTAEWITSWGRAPGIEKAIVLADNAWFGPWLESFWQSRTLRLNLYLAVGLLVPLLYRQGRQAWRSALRLLPWAWLPTLTTGVVWFVTAPDVRFGWLSFVGLAGIPLALLLAFGAFPAMLARVAGVLVLVLMVLSNIPNGRISPRGADPAPVALSWGPITTEVMLGPPPPVILRPLTLSDGSPAWTAEEHYCWDVVPACLFADPARLYKLGPEVTDGYATLDRDAR